VSGPGGGPSGKVTLHSTYNAITKTTDTDLHNNTITYTYDGLYRIASTTLPVSANPNGGGHAVISTVYDALGHKIPQSDANGNVPTYTYDDDYRITSVTDPMKNTVTYSYDKSDNVTGSTDSRTGLVVAYTVYDALNRLRSMTETVRRGDP